jgi:hypothetical protein
MANISLAEHFFAPRSGTHAHFQFYQIVVICSLSSDIVHVEYLDFYVQVLDNKAYNPFRYMFETGM